MRKVHIKDTYCRYADSKNHVFYIAFLEKGRKIIIIKQQAPEAYFWTA